MTACKFILPHLLGLGIATLAAASEQPWQKITFPSATDAAILFAAPPPEYSAQFTWGWGGPVDREVIARDLDGMQALGVQAAAVEPKAGMKSPYLSPEYFALAQVAVEEAKRRNMRLWFMDDGDYPSGLAGGKFTREAPALRMMALVPSERFAVAGGETISRNLGEGAVAAVAFAGDGHANIPLDVSTGKLTWTAPAGKWEVAITRRAYRTLPTRSANSATGAKDTSQSLMDFLDPQAADLFRKWTFEGYNQAVGAEFGKTVLGFRGDEPAFVPNPWTPQLLAEFQRKKGYDLRPYLAAISAGPAPKNPALNPAERRVYADYCDVWSDLYRDSYFNMEASWCREHGLEMQLHIEHEEILPQLATADGDYFKIFRNIQMPGIDIIWHQIWMDNPADFPKLASSAAHLYGHPRAMCEAFAAYQPAPNLEQAKWLLDFLMVHGISHIEYMFYPASVPRGTAPNGGPPPGVRSDGANALRRAPNAQTIAAAGGSENNGSARPGNRSAGTAGFRPGGGSRYYRHPGFPQVATYVNRLSYLLGEGKPAAQIGLYIPSSSFWIAEAADAQRLDESLLAIAHDLIAHQQDFDYVDEQALTSVLQPVGDRLVNLSGQGYRAIVVPPALAISATALQNLKAFAARGGTVIFIGEKLPVVVERNFLQATKSAAIEWASLHEMSSALTPAVLQKLPTSDFRTDNPAPLVEYNHRQIKGADVYFIFNSGDATTAPTVTLAGRGAAQIWDPLAGTITGMAAEKLDEQHVNLTVPLKAWGTAVVVLGQDLPPVKNPSGPPTVSAAVPQKL